MRGKYGVTCIQDNYTNMTVKLVTIIIIFLIEKRKNIFCTTLYGEFIENTLHMYCSYVCSILIYRTFLEFVKNVVEEETNMKILFVIL